MSDSATSTIVSVSDGLAAAAEKAGASVVLVDARHRIPATGIAWQADGIVVTADHILERDDGVSVTLPNGTSIPATIIGREPGSDLAVLKIEADVNPAETTAQHRVGELVLALGRPEPSLMASLGVVSAVGGPWQTATGVPVDGFIRTDTTFYPGFSGGPLINAKGAVVGLNSSRLGRGGGLTVPAATVDRIVQALVQHGRIRRGFLGVTSQPVEAAAASGLLIVSIAESSPADSAGILVGDILVGFDGNTIDASTDLRRYLDADSIGRKIDVGVIRAGDSKIIKVEVGERPTGE